MTTSALPQRPVPGVLGSKKAATTEPPQWVGQTGTSDRGRSGQRGVVLEGLTHKMVIPGLAVAGQGAGALTFGGFYKGMAIRPILTWESHIHCFFAKLFICPLSNQQSRLTATGKH